MVAESLDLDQTMDEVLDLLAGVDLIGVDGPEIVQSPDTQLLPFVSSLPGDISPFPENIRSFLFTQIKSRTLVISDHRFVM
jgi:hypothetical protein